jgi:hypothetical protein
VKVKDRPPVPPLPPNAVANIERRALSALDGEAAPPERSRLPRLVWALALALLAVAALDLRELRRGDGPAQTTLRARFQTARRQEASDPTAALRAYQELARGDGDSAANALFAAARLEAQRGQAARARELLEAYQRRFPTGSNIEDARSLLRGLR